MVKNVHCSSVLAYSHYFTKIVATILKGAANILKVSIKKMKMKMTDCASVVVVTQRRIF